MEISAINHNRYNVATKSQYDTYPAANTASYPMYVEEEEPKSKSNLGMVALGILGLVGIGYGIWKHHDSKAVVEALEKSKTALEEATTKLAESEEKVNVTEKALDAAKQELEALKNPAKKKFKINWKFWTWFKGKKA